MNGADDPGWGYALRALIPILGLRYSAQRAPDGLTALRSIFVGLVAALPLFGVAFSFLDPETGSSGAAPLAVVLVGLLSIWGIELLHRRPLATMSMGSLAASWRTRFFISVGIAEIPSLVAVAVTFAGVALWIYLVGLVFSLLGFFRIAPFEAEPRSGPGRDPLDGVAPRRDRGADDRGTPDPRIAAETRQLRVGGRRTPTIS